MKILTEGIKRPQTIEVNVTYKGVVESIKITNIYIKINPVYTKESLVLFDYDWVNPAGKKGKKKGATLSEILNYFED